MLTFLLFTIIFWIANACAVRVAHFSIQEGQWVDSLCGWQNMLDRLYASNNPFLKWWYKPLGGCEMCFSHFVNVAGFILYAIFSVKALHYWVSDGVAGWAWKIVITVIWYLVFMNIGTIFSLQALKGVFNLFKKKEA